uniref:Uncharacterized protein n=1 Tax=Rhodosorus marinus TaxID=101924 RepID=A0A7S2ZCE7_9RHOD|mmetsp:Transcript_11959/g.49942  ORF Transcript_11959/g.49942 Transcript_11959/m.49942 type:complete len:244 (+) Transcript_11959:356-1087(+)
MDMARKKGIRFHGSLKAIERLKGPADHQKFIQAVHEREVRLLQHLPPSANCLAGALDTITYRGTLLVVYACVNSVVVALGADLSVLRQISLPAEVVQKSGGRKPITAVTFRPADAAVVVGVQGFVVIYHGWYEGQVPERLWNSCEYEAIIPFGDDSGSRKISSLSFSLDSRRLAVVGDGVEVLECAQQFDEAGNASGKVVYESEMRVKAADCCEGVDYTLGSISPRGNLLVAASEGAEAGRAW